MEKSIVSKLSNLLDPGAPAAVRMELLPEVEARMRCSAMPFEEIKGIQMQSSVKKR